MAEPFDDMADINPFADPSVVAASNKKNEPVPKVQMSVSPHQSPPHISPQSPIRAKLDTGNYIINDVGSGFSNVGIGLGMSSTSNTQSTTIQKEMMELQQREDALKKRESELRRLEQQVAAATGIHVNNFPPLPAWFCLKPCFYINIAEEIRLENQLTVKQVFHQWIAYSIALIINIIVMIVYLASGGKDGTISLILAIILGLIFIPLSFVFCFRPLYTAMKTNSSFNFILFFFSYSIQTLIHAVQCLGISGNGWAGFINGAYLFDTSKPLGGGLCMIMGAIYVALLVFNIIMIRRVGVVYRGSGASIQEAQNEFTAGAWKSGVSTYLNANQPLRSGQ